MSAEKKKHLKGLSAAWNSDEVACCLFLARHYTGKYKDDLIGWLVLGDTLAKISSFDEARQALRTAERLCPEERIHTVYHYVGHLHKRKGNLRLAEKWYRRAIDAKATTRNLIFLGGCLAKQGRYPEAKKCHRRAIKIASDVPDEAWFNLGLILRAEGKNKEGLECFEKAIELDPDYRAAKTARKDLLRLERIKNRP